MIRYASLPALALVSLVLLGCTAGKETAATTAKRARATATFKPNESISAAHGACLRSATASNVKPMTFARADSIARRLLATPDFRELVCVVSITATDSSLILSYESAPKPAPIVPGAIVLQYGGGTVVEVYATGGGRVLYSTQ